MAGTFAADGIGIGVGVEFCCGVAEVPRPASSAARAPDPNRESMETAAGGTDAGGATGCATATGGGVGVCVKAAL
jgi:hypothetical protein